MAEKFSARRGIVFPLCPRASETSWWPSSRICRSILIKFFRLEKILKAVIIFMRSTKEAVVPFLQLILKLAFVIQPVFACFVCSKLIVLCSNVCVSTVVCRLAINILCYCIIPSPLLFSSVPLFDIIIVLT